LGDSQIIIQPLKRAPSSSTNSNVTIPLHDEALSGGGTPNAPAVSGNKTEVEDEDSSQADHDTGSPTTDDSLATSQLAPANDAKSLANETGIDARQFVRLLSRNETKSIDSTTDEPDEHATNGALQSKGGELIAVDSDEAKVEGDELEEIEEVLEEIEDAIEEMEKESDGEAEIPSSEDDLSLAAEEAAIEAEELAIKAAEATLTNTTSEVDTSTAIVEAAEAAKKAKDATVLARSKTNAEALMSGNAELMTSVLATCFSDQKYGIRKIEETQVETQADTNEDSGVEEDTRHATEVHSTYAYIYLDGDVFIRLNLTSPYWGTTTFTSAVPTPNSKPGGQGDIIDWAIFTFILTLTAFGFLVMVHQLGIIVDKRLRFRHFFHPTLSDEEWEAEHEPDEEAEQSPLKGAGFPHSALSMQVESIPESMRNMGGQAVPYSDDPGEPSWLVSGDGGSDIEMAAQHGRLRSDYYVSSEMVDRPSLQTSSKVAMPHQSPKDESSPRMDMSIAKVEGDNGIAKPDILKIGLPLPT